MLRTILGVVVGYIAMVVCVFGALVAAYSLLGEGWAFQEGSYRTSTRWAVMMLAVGFAAACVGGMVCKVVAGRSRRAVPALAVAVLILGGLDTAMRLAGPEPTEAELVRSESTPVFEAVGKAKSPTWIGFANPFVGVLGVFLGASIVGTKRAAGGPPSNS